MDREARTNEEVVRESLLEPKVSQGDGYVDITFGPVTFRYRVTSNQPGPQGQQGGREDDKGKDYKQSSKGQDQQGGQEGREGQDQGGQGQQDQKGQGGQQGGQGSPGGESGDGGQGAGQSSPGGGKSKSSNQKGRRGGQSGASDPDGADGDEDGDSSGGEERDGGEKEGASRSGEDGSGRGKEGETGPGDEGSGEDGESGGGDKKGGKGQGKEKGEGGEPNEGSEGSGSGEGEDREGSGASQGGKGPLNKYWGDSGEGDDEEGGEGGGGGGGGEDDNKRQGPGGDPGDDEGSGGGKEGDKDGKGGKGEDGEENGSDSDSSKDGDKGGRKPSKQKKKDGEKSQRPPFSDEIEGIRLSPEDFERIFGKDDEDSSPEEILFGGRKEVSGEVDISSKGSFGLSYGQSRITVHNVGDVSSVKPENLQFHRDNSIAKALRSFLEPVVLAPTTALDPGVQVFGTPVRRFSGGNSGEIPSWSKPRVSFGALSTLESFDLTKLIIAVDVSGSMDANLVYSALRTYFATISSLSPSYANKRFEVLLIVFGDDVVLARIQGVPSVLAAKAVRIAFDENVLSLTGQGTSAPVVLFPKLNTVIQRGINLSSKEAFIRGSVPVIFITDFLWPTGFSITGDFVNFMRNKPFIGFETTSAPITVSSGNKGDTWSPHSLSLKILSLTPYGMLLNFPGPVSTIYVTKEASEKMKKPSGISVRVVSSRARALNGDE